MIALNSSIDKAFDEMFERFSTIPRPLQNGLSYQVKESADQSSLVLEVEVPGVDPNEVKVEAKGRAIVVECPKGSTYVTAGSRLDLDNIKATVKWGLLTVTIPRRDTKSVEVKVIQEG